MIRKIALVLTGVLVGLALHLTQPRTAHQKFLDLGARPAWESRYKTARAPQKAQEPV